MRGVAVKAVACQREGQPWRAQSPRELRAGGHPNGRVVVAADFRVEQHPEVERTCVQRHEGNGVGDGARLHERSKALKGATP
jgi:hypothetical protein